MNRVHFHNIADEAGVSVRTLYRVMNNQGAVSSATRRKVVTALNRYGYLCSGQKESQTILFDIIRSSFIERVGILLMQRLSLRDFRCVLSNHTEQKERFLDAVSQAAVVVMCSFPTETLLQEVRAANPDCTIVNILGGVGGDVAIDSDDYQGGQLAARHLFANGHRHVGVFSSLDQPNHVERYKSFLGQMLFLDPGCKYYIRRHFLSVEDAAELIRSAGGKPVIAHPRQYKLTPERFTELMERARACGVAGLECYYSGYDEQTVAKYLAAAEQYGFCPTAGSDWHGKNKPHIHLGSGMNGELAAPYEILEKLRDHE